MIVEVLHTVNLSQVLEGSCSEAVYDCLQPLEPPTIEIEVEIDRHDEIREVSPGPEGCTVALYLWLLPHVTDLLEAGEYQEIIEALRNHERRWHDGELPTLAMRELRERQEFNGYTSEQQEAI